ncbi:MAG: hypothetical protein QM642_11035 [Edaphocola sp.]
MENRNGIKAEIAKVVAQKHHITVRSVYRILAGDQNNQAAFDDFYTLWQEHHQRMAMYQDTPLLNAVKELVPFK